MKYIFYSHLVIITFKYQQITFKAVADELFQYVWPFCGVGA